MSVDIVVNIQEMREWDVRTGLNTGMIGFNTRSKVMRQKEVKY